MLRGIGLSLYLACLGLDAGAHFFETVMRPEGAIWIGLGFAITFLPVVIMALIALRMSHLDFGSTCGMRCVEAWPTPWHLIMPTTLCPVTTLQ